MKFKTLLAVAAVTASVGANALVETGNDGEMVFSAWDPVQKVSYTLDTGIKHKALLDEYQNAGYSLNFMVDPLYNTVFANSNQSDIIWNVSVAGTDFFDKYGVQFTSKTVPVTFPSFQTLANVAAIHVQYSQALQGVNAAAGNVSYNGDTNNGAYAGDNGLWGRSWALQAGLVDNSASVGDSMNWYFMGLSDDFSTADLKSTALQSWTFNGSKLTFAAAQPVPVPAAAWLLASGLVGLTTISRRRKKAA